MKRTLYQAAMLLAMAFAAVSCGEKKNEKAASDPLSTDVVTNPASASGAASQAIAKMAFERDTYDFGKITQGEKVEYAFKFKNTGEADLVISSASGSCGCTVPEYPKEPVKPGAEGVINVVFDSEGKTGTQHKTVTLIANTVPNNTVLNIKGEVIVPEGEAKKE
jgi:hypothetical protein